MKSSVLRAQSQKDVSWDESCIVSILNGININMGNKVNKIIRADDFAYSGKSLDQGPNSYKTNDRFKIYENKIRLMT